MQYASESIEDYLTAAYRLQNGGEVRSRQLCDYLKVKKSSVSEMLSRLGKLGLVMHMPYSGIALTKKGESMARKMLFKHRVIEMFLVKMLKRGKNSVHDEAHLLEHAFSDRSVRRIYALLGKPKTGIHGEPIPLVNFKR